MAANGNTKSSYALNFNNIGALRAIFLFCSGEGCGSAITMLDKLGNNQTSFPSRTTFSNGP